MNSLVINCIESLKFVLKDYNITNYDINHESNVFHLTSQWKTEVHCDINNPNQAVLAKEQLASAIAKVLNDYKLSDTPVGFTNSSTINPQIYTRCNLIQLIDPSEFQHV